MITLTYWRFGEMLSESFDGIAQALDRSHELLEKHFGVPVSMTTEGQEIYDQEQLFSDWTESLQAA